MRVDTAHQTYIIYDTAAQQYEVRAHTEGIFTLKMADTWTEEQEGELIDMWKDAPVLYKHNNKGYKHRGLTYAARHKIAEHFGCSADDICKRMISLRTQCTRYVMLPKSESGAKARTKRQEWIISKLDFLRDYITKGQSRESQYVGSDTEKDVNKDIAIDTEEMIDAAQDVESQDVDSQTTDDTDLQECEEVEVENNLTQSSHDAEVNVLPEKKKARRSSSNTPPSTLFDRKTAQAQKEHPIF